MLDFLRSYGKVKKDSAIQAGIEALGTYDPNGLTDAQLDLMDKELSGLARSVGSTQQKLNEARGELTKMEALNTERLEIAGVLEHQIEAETDPAKKASLEASLEKQLATIEAAQPQLKDLREHAKDLQETLSSYTEAHAAKATAILTARKELEAKANAIARGELRLEGLREKEEAAKVAAGVKKTTDTIKVATRAFDSRLEKLNAQIEASKLNASVLTPVDHETTDANIAAARAQVNKVTPKSTSERLAALKAAS